jgi:hypothetical protein
MRYRARNRRASRRCGALRYITGRSYMDLNSSDEEEEPQTSVAVAVAAVAEEAEAEEAEVVVEVENAGGKVAGEEAEEAVKEEEEEEEEEEEVEVEEAEEEQAAGAEAGAEEPQIRLAVWVAAARRPTRSNTDPTALLELADPTSKGQRSSEAVPPRPASTALTVIWRAGDRVYARYGARLVSKNLTKWFPGAVRCVPPSPNPNPNPNSNPNPSPNLTLTLTLTLTPSGSLHVVPSAPPTTTARVTWPTTTATSRIACLLPI